MQSSNATDDYVIRVYDDPSMVDKSAWRDLLLAQAEPTPFMDLAFLGALHASGSATAETGWSPLFLTLWHQETLHASCALYLKSHSYGEYVFDWAWADAYGRAGLDYYPKLLSAVPFTPVPGTRLMARSDRARRALAQALVDVVQRQGLSSAHVLFIDSQDAQALEAAGWMIRRGVQFHWQQDMKTPVNGFEDLLARMQRDKRKKIQQEQRRVREAGVTFEALEGRQIKQTHWDYFHDCYTLTYRLHRSTPYLRRNFFDRMAQDMPENWLLFMARVGDEPVGCSLIALDPGRGVAYGRYWGSTRHIPCLHFDACYYQPLAWCLSKGYRRFEGGAQGEHKMARGLMPVPTQSAHWVADPRFARAVDDFLQKEGAHVGAYVDELREHSPFKSDLSGP